MVLSEISGQSRVRDFLQKSISEQKISHAYLFVAQTSSGAAEMALAFAQALLCEKGGCGSCSACKKVSRKSHPDLHELKPLGVGEYLLSQIKDLLNDVELQSVYGGKKVYILHDVHLLGEQCANALLKTLEEPPADCVFILITSDRRKVLPTIVSRCQLIPFRIVSDKELAEIVMQHTGVSRDKAVFALAACNNSLVDAKSFLQSSYKFELRLHVLDVFDRLKTMDALDVLQASKSILLEAKSPLDQLKETQAALLDEQGDFLSKSVQKELEIQQRRELTQAQRSGIIEVLNIIRSYVRDALLLLENSEARIVNEDRRSSLLYLLKQTDGQKLFAMLTRIDKAQMHINRNVSAQLSFDALLFDLKAGI